MTQRREKPEDIQQFLMSTYPDLGGLIADTVTIDRIEPRTEPVPESVVKVVIGQMLSRHAARTIYERVREYGNRKGFRGSWEVPNAQLRRCGVSGRKIKTIRRFASNYSRNPSRIDAWTALEWEDLRETVCGHWGLSDWTASILAIFHFGHEDVFPINDGSLKRAAQLISVSHVNGGFSLEAELASPYRSYLALYLWKALDEGRIASI
jgi:DNA-3-methyladenine glycosylase II